MSVHSHVAFVACHQYLLAGWLGLVTILQILNLFEVSMGISTSLPTKQNRLNQTCALSSTWLKGASVWVQQGAPNDADETGFVSVWKGIACKPYGFGSKSITPTEYGFYCFCFSVLSTPIWPMACNNPLMLGTNWWMQWKTPQHQTRRLGTCRRAMFSLSPTWIGVSVWFTDI